MIAAFLPAQYSGKAGHPYVSHRRALNGLAPAPRHPRVLRPLEHDPDPLPPLAARGRVAADPGRPSGSRPQTGAHQLRLLGFRRLQRARPQVRGRSGKKVDGQTLSPEQSQEKQARGTSRGSLWTKIHVLCEGEGRPITEAGSHEVACFMRVSHRVSANHSMHSAPFCICFTGFLRLFRVDELSI